MDAIGSGVVSEEGDRKWIVREPDFGPWTLIGSVCGRGVTRCSAIVVTRDAIAVKSRYNGTQNRYPDASW